MSIKVVSCSFAELFSGKILNDKVKYKLKIPEYQRPYVWKTKQIRKLVADLNVFQENYTKESPLYYLGTIILHKDKNNLNIIDGQQRISTLALLDYFINNKEQNIAYSSPNSIAQIKKNYEVLASKTFELEELNLNLLNITLVITNNEDDAYTFFETQNTGGKRLSGADIVKAHHLRAIKNKDLVSSNASKWENKNINSVNEVIEILAKARNWNSFNWLNYPHFKDKTLIKEEIVERFTIEPTNSEIPISYYQSEISETPYNQSTKNSSYLKAIRQPLFNGAHYIDYLSDYIDVYEELFKKKTNFSIDKRYFDFRDKLLDGENGTVFLIELYQITLIAYVSKFGLENLYEFALWLFRYIYSKRVINKKTVREDSIHSFVRDEKLIDKILVCYTHQEVITMLKNYNYTFNVDNCEEKNTKGRYILNLPKYFTTLSPKKIVNKAFDKFLIEAINNKLNHTQDEN